MIYLGIIVIVWMILGLIGSFMYKLKKAKEVKDVKRTPIWYLICLFFGPITIGFAIRFNEQFKND